MPGCSSRTSRSRLDRQAPLMIRALGLLLVTTLAGCSAMHGLGRLLGISQPRSATPSATAAPPVQAQPPSTVMIPPTGEEQPHEHPARSKPPKAPPKPAPVVTSTSSPSEEAVNQQQARQAIDAAQGRMEQAAHTDPDAKLDIVRSMIASAQQAFDDHDYLTARSLARKASVLAGQAAAQSTPTPIR